MACRTKKYMHFKGQRKEQELLAILHMQIVSAQKKIYRGIFIDSLIPAFTFYYIE